MFEGILVLGIVLAVVTVVGHGIWKGLELLLRGLTESRDGSERKNQVQCGHCQRWTSRLRQRCDWCNRDIRGPVADELADLIVFERQLRRFRSQNLLDSTALEDLQDKAEQRRRVLMHAALEKSAEEERPATAGQPVRLSEPARSQPEQEPLIVAESVQEPAAKPVSQPVRDPLPPVDQPKAPPLAKPPVPRAAIAPGPAPKPQPVKPPRPPRKPILETLAAFLEERNIHWAELVCVLIPGLVIVGSSIALVINFWETLEARPYLKFSIFVAYSSAVFGAGLLCHQRWKLLATGRGLLLIATLLVPLNFLAMASLSREHWSLMTLATELVSLGVFAWLMSLAGRVLVPGGRWHQTAAVVGNSAAVLLVARLTGAGAEGWAIAAIGLLPVTVFGAALLLYLRRFAGRTEIDSPAADALFTLLGTAAFALATALGLLLERGARAADLASTLDHGSLLAVLSAVPVLMAGLTVVRGTTQDKSLSQNREPRRGQAHFAPKTPQNEPVPGGFGIGSKSQGAYRTAGTAVALLGGVLMVLAVVLAWPDPPAVLLAGTAAAAALAWVALQYDVPLAHAGVVAAGLTVYLTAYHLLAGNLPWTPGEDAGRTTLRLALGFQSGAALTGLAALLGGAAALIARLHRRDHALPYAAGCGLVAMLSLFSVTGHALHGNAAALPAAMTLYGLYGAGSLMANAWVRRPMLTYLGLGLLAASTVWAMRWQIGQITPLWATLLAGESLALALISAALHRSSNPASVPWNQERNDSDRTGILELYRLPPAQVAELLAPLAIVIGVWTAWSDRVLIHASPEPALAALFITLLYVLLAWGYRSPARTYLASSVALAGLVHTFVLNYTDWVEQPWLIALLTHATASVVAGVALQWWLRSGSLERVAGDIRDVFTQPLGEIALASSTLAIPAIVLGSWGETLWMAGCLFWLSAIWLVIAWTNRWPAMFAAAQGALTVAALTATTAWLQHHPWNVNRPVDLSDPRVLQVYGVGLAILTLVWLAARMLLRDHAVARQLFDYGGPAIDRLVGHGTVVVQLLVVAVSLAPGCVAELGRRVGGAAAAAPLEAFGPTAWLLLVTLTIGLVAAFWHRWRESEMVSSLLAVITVPALAAGTFGSQLATASALRWALAATFLAVAAAVWQRKKLLKLAGSLRARVDLTPLAPSLARTTLLWTTALPVVGLTLLAAGLQLLRVRPGGPLPLTIFDAISPEVSYLVPLLLVIGGLVGFALRESSAGYAFWAGLVVTMTAVLGYLLNVSALGTEQAATVVQLATISAAVWAILWLAARRGSGVFFRVGREDSVHQSDRSPPDTQKDSRPLLLMGVQLAMGVLGNAVLLGPALFALVFYPYRWQGWTMAAGSWIGWIALVTSMAALIVRRIQCGRKLSPGFAGFAGMTALALLACTVRALVPDAPEWGYRTLMLGWAIYALVTVLAAWWVAGLRTLPGAQGPPQALLRAASTWVATAGLLAVALGLKAALFHDAYIELLWAAAAIAVASLAGATMAFWRREEGWAFAAAPGVNLAASLVVWYTQWYHEQQLSPEAWLILLGQANVIASMAVALVWLAARRRLYQLRDLTIRTSPLLGIQTALGVVGNAALLVPPVVVLFADPNRLPPWTLQVAEPAGWIALIATALAAAWYLWQVKPHQSIDVLAGLGLGAGVLGSCLAADAGALATDGWSAYHVLTAAWAAVGLIVLGTGALGRNLRLTGHAAADSSEERWLPARFVQGWVTAIGAAVLALALVHCGEDPARPWWSLRAIAGVSLMAGLLGIWLRRPGAVLVSALLFNVAGAVYGGTATEATAGSLAAIQVLAFATAAILWSLLEWAHREGVPVLMLGERRVPIAHLASLAGVGLLAAYAWALVMAGIWRIPHAAPGTLGWSALTATVLAAVVLLWDVRARFPLVSLYVAALVSLAMLLTEQHLAPHALAWSGALALAGFSLLAATLARILPQLQPLSRALRISSEESRWPSDWFPAAQMALTLAAAGLSLWISLDAVFQQMANPAVVWLSGRPAGPLAAAMLLPAAVLTARWATGTFRRTWQNVAFVLGLLLAAELGWAWLDPAIAAPWLHRSVVLMVAAVAMTLVAGFGVPRLLPPESDWTAEARRAVPGLGGLALAMLAAVLVQEGALYVPGKGTPMALPAVVVVAVALAGLIAAALTFAVVGSLDPLRLSDRSRTAYVYAAEALGALVGLHLRLTAPELFRLGIIEQYWMLIVLAVAFAGAALSEWFDRRGLPVLSEPLIRTAALLPVAPALGFWFFLTPDPTLGFAGASPGLWLLASIFYGLLAAMRRSTVYGILSGVVLSIGLCVLWYQLDFRFLEHPQLWMIPFALVVLVSEFLNHDRLTSNQSTALRYIALSVIYISSSSEYLRAIGESLALPMTLILLSMAGVLAGVVLRIRSFLYMGSSFLMLVVVTMIKYAAVDQRQTWILWIFCIVLCTAIIATFAVFEKRRLEILSAIQRFRTWQR